MTRFIHLDQRKWPDREHYQFKVQWLGHDEHGTWVHAKAGTVVRRGQDEPSRFEQDFVGVIPDDEWWVANFYTGHPKIDVYVDIGTPPAWNGHRLTYIDLDLDVIRRLDGTVEVIDEDEFEENRIAFDYPADLVIGARSAAERAVRLIRERLEPFGGAAERWLSGVDPESLRRRSDE